MMLSPQIVERMIFLLQRVDDAIDDARAEIAKGNAAAAMAAIRQAEARKRRVIYLCPDEVSDIYDIFYFLDLAADTATTWPNGSISDGVSEDDVIENLEQSLEDVEYQLEDDLYLPAEIAALEALADWLRKMIEHYYDKTLPAPGGSLCRVHKAAFFGASDASGLLDGLYGYLDTLDRGFYYAAKVLAKAPPDFDEASDALRIAEANKHLFIDWLREQPTSKDPDDQGGEDLPKHPDHA